MNSQKSTPIIFAILALCLFTSLLTSPPSLANQEASSSSASASASTTNEQITQNLKQRLQQTLEKVKENILTTTSQPRAYFGRIKEIVQNTITVETPTGSSVFVKIDDSTTLLRNPGNTPIKFTNISLDDSIIAMGYPSDNKDTLQGKRVLILKQLSLDLSKQSGIGKISHLTSSSLTLTPLAPNNNKQEDITLTLSKNTIVKNQQTILKLSDLAEDQTIVYTADTSGRSPLATIIMITNQ